MKIGIYTNIYKDKDFIHSKKIFNYLKDKNIQAYTNFNMDEKDFFNKIDLLILLGGDGTFLSVAEVCAKKSIPILGINLGTLGYLTSIEKNEINHALDCIIDSKYKIDERVMIETTFKGKRYIALNDLVINKCINTTVVTTEININGTEIGSVRGDGLILSTPTGSTAYNYSAGGPILEPNSKTYVITPICSQSAVFRSIVISKDDIVKIKIISRSDNDIALMVDGKYGTNIVNDDVLIFKYSNYKVKLINISEKNFFEVFKNKLSSL